MFMIQHDLETEVPQFKYYHVITDVTPKCAS